MTSDIKETKKTSKTSLLVATATGAALLSGIWAFYNSPAISDKLTDVEGATQTLKGGNLKPLQVGGYSALGCGRGEWVATSFTAENTSGERVSGTVCKTLFGRFRITFGN